MMILNGKKLAENEKEFTDSLFEPGGTCVGYAKKNAKSVSILDHNRNKVGCINRHGVLCCATKQDSGGYWYSYADIDILGRYESYMQEHEEIRDAIAYMNR